jgi:hypothetical protein
LFGTNKKKKKMKNCKYVAADQILPRGTGRIHYVSTNTHWHRGGKSAPLSLTTASGIQARRFSLWRQFHWWGDEHLQHMWD